MYLTIRKIKVKLNSTSSNGKFSQNNSESAMTDLAKQDYIMTMYTVYIQ